MKKPGRDSVSSVPEPADDADEIRTDLLPADQSDVAAAVRERTVETLRRCALALSCHPGDGVGRVIADAMRQLVGRIQSGHLMVPRAMGADGIDPPDRVDVTIMEITADLDFARATTNGANGGPIAAVDLVLAELSALRRELEPYKRADWRRAVGMIQAIEYAIRLGCRRGKSERVPGIVDAIGLGKEEVP